MPHFNVNHCFYRRLTLCTALLVSLINHVNAQSFPVDNLIINGNRNNRINLVYLSDGYQPAELGTYITNVTTINNALFAQAPFSQYNKFFNSYAIRVPSTQSGAIHPGTASDEASSGGQPVANPAIYFRSTFDFGSIHRLLVPQNNVEISTVLSANTPDYDQAFIVVNSPFYGGSGGAYATSSTHTSSAEVAIHEIGHSFAGLADEYWAGDIYASEKRNMTQNNNPTTIKWKNWLGINGIGIYPYGTSGNPALWFRPHELCKMQYLGYPFCAVCTEAFIDRIHQLVSMIDDYLPATTSFTLTNTSPVSFSVTGIQTVPNTNTVNWYLNGSPTALAANTTTVTVPIASFHDGNNALRAELIDNTALSKSYLPGAGYVNSITWTVNKPIGLPVVIKDFSGRIINNIAKLNWEMGNMEDISGFEVEKSTDGIRYAKIAFVSGLAAVKSYHAADQNLLPAVGYYRLRIVEKAGSTVYSNVIKLNNAFSNFFYKVYQNEAAHAYHLKCGLGNVKEKIAVQVFNESGQRMVYKNFGNVNTQLDADVDLSGKPAGIYFMHISISNRNYMVKLIAK